MYNELVAFNDPKCGVSEAIRTLRTNLSFTFTDDKIKCIMITSSVPGEGKSFISANLAYAFSLDNKKVLLVDADLRRGRVNKIFSNYIHRYRLHSSRLLLRLGYNSRCCDAIKCRRR